MADIELTDEELAIFFDEAKAEVAPEIPLGLMERVLADAAEIGAGFVEPTSAVTEKQNWFARMFTPIGGVGGAFALGAFASVGLVVGLGDAETLYSLPVVGDILVTISGEVDGSTPLDTLDYLMAES